MSRTLESFDVEEKPSAAVESQCPNVCVIQASVTALHAAGKVTGDFIPHRRGIHHAQFIDIYML